ncbi:acetyl-coenzyme A synthetase 2 [Friedmanniomyces endolithicus]|nr:acetyl-coenzyme A synthetase 2 [Friedmanniomyces endolithicus]
MARTVWGAHKRYMDTYLNVYKGVYFTGDGAARDHEGYYWIRGRVDDVVNVSGHRLSTAEIEAALIEHQAVGEAAVVGINDELTGQAVDAFVSIKEDNEINDALRKELIMQVRKSIGPFATPKAIFCVPDLPKTRSGKIMRRILRKILAGEEDQLGDTSTLSDPSVVDKIIETVHAAKGGKNDLADAVHADIIRLDANDIQDLTDEYVGQGQDSPGSFSTFGYDVFDGYTATALGRSVKPPSNSAEDADEIDVDEDEYDEDDEDAANQSSGSFGSIEDLRKALHERRHEIGKALQSVGIAGISIGPPQVIHLPSAGQRTMAGRASPLPSENGVQWDDARLGALLDGMLNAAEQKRTASTAAEHDDTTKPSVRTSVASSRLTWAAQLFVSYLTKSVEAGAAKIELDFQKHDLTPDHPWLDTSRRRTIVHIRDMKDVCRSRLGDAVVRKLVQVVQKRPRSGESVLIVGTTAQANNHILMTNLQETGESLFRTITIPLLPEETKIKVIEPTASANAAALRTLKEVAYKRILEVNLRHVRSTGRSCRMSGSWSAWQIECLGSEFVNPAVDEAHNLQPTTGSVWTSASRKNGCLRQMCAFPS